MKQQRINSLCNRSSASVFWGHNFRNDNDPRFCIAHMLICVVIYTDLYVAPMALNSDVLGSSPGSVGCLSGEFCIYIAPIFSNDYSMFHPFLPCLYILYTDSSSIHAPQKLYKQQV